MKKAAVLPGMGIGDALNLLIASYAYQLKGYDVTTYSNHMHLFGPWLKNHRFKKPVALCDFVKEFADFDTLIVHFDNTERSKQAFQLREKGLVKNVFLFYNNYRHSKHPPLKKGFDFAFDESRSVTHNIAETVQKLLHLQYPPKDIGMTIPSHLIHKKNPRRVIIHPTSSWDYKNWSAQKFIGVARKLQNMQLCPTITLSPSERKDWLFAMKYGIDIPLIRDLADLAKITYESGFFIGNDSGPGHLASYLQIPSIILAAKPSISHWKPGWLEPAVLLPLSWIPNVKGMRLREKKWQSFITIRRVIKTFKSAKIS